MTEPKAGAGLILTYPGVIMGPRRLPFFFPRRTVTCRGNQRGGSVL